jgi:hypothetical protein
MDENRNVRMVALEERQFTITGLASDVPYEFRVAAVNEVGAGIWSDVSLPVVMDNPERVSGLLAVCRDIYSDRLTWFLLCHLLVSIASSPCLNVAVRRPRCRS